MNKKGQMSMMFLILLMAIIVIFAVFVDVAKEQTKFIDSFKIDKNPYIPITNSFYIGNINDFKDQVGKDYIHSEDTTSGNHYGE